jgi:ribosomal protein S18 acetylase RimI-like enzyme
MGEGVDIRPAYAADIPWLAEMFLQSSHGVIEWLYQGAIPGRPSNIIVEHLFTRFGTALSFSNCWVALEEKRVAGVLHAAPSNLMIGGPPDLLIPEERRKANDPYSRLRTPDTFHIISVAVAEGRRGRGTGERLMHEAEAQAARLELSQLTLNVVESNTGAIRLYQRLGYREVTRERVSIPDTLEGDVIHMALLLESR